MYDLKSYGKMMADQVRMDAYVAALREAVKPGCVVLEIGTGAGIFAMLACRYGARRVYAVEPSEAIETARAAAVANGFANRIEFIQDVSTNIDLPERADVIISDLRGVLPYFQNNITSVIDARERLLASHGVLIPQRDCLRVAVVSAPELYDDFIAPWDEHGCELDWQAACHKVLNTWDRVRVEPEQILLPAQCAALLDYTRVVEPGFKAELSWTAAKDGTAHGLIAWFDTTLIEGVQFSSGPGQPDPVYGNAFFPWLQPVPLTAGDTVAVTLQANRVGMDYMWGWQTVVMDRGQPDQIKASFKQSTFFGMQLSPARLRRRAEGFIPALNEEGRIKQFILTQMTSEKSLSDIADQVAVKFPTRFVTAGEALALIRDVSQKYSR